MEKMCDIVIPAEIRKNYGLKPEDLIMLMLYKVNSEGKKELKHLGALLEKAGYKKKEDVLKLVDEVKDELCNVYIVAALDLARNIESAEVKIIKAANRSEV